MLLFLSTRQSISLAALHSVAHQHHSQLAPHQSCLRPPRCKRASPFRLTASLPSSAMAKEVPQLGPVQMTLLLPLFARAEETRNENGILSDPKAVEIIETLDYDFSPWAGVSALRGVGLRTIMIDQDVKQFLEKYPNGTVVEIGCGLNTRFERLDNGTVRWFDIDLPDSIALRRKYFNDEPRRTMIAANVLDKEWMDVVKSTGGPWCFVSEAVIIFLENPQARQAITQIAEAFPECWLSIDTVSQKMVDTQGVHPLMKCFEPESWFRWACDDPAEIEEWTGLSMKKRRTMADGPPEVYSKLPFPFNFLMMVAPFVVRWMSAGYHISLFVGRSDAQE